MQRGKEHWTYSFGGLGECVGQVAESGRRVREIVAALTEKHSRSARYLVNDVVKIVLWEKDGFGTEVEALETGDERRHHLSVPPMHIDDLPCRRERVRVACTVDRFWR